MLLTLSIDVLFYSTCSTCVHHLQLLSLTFIVMLLPYLLMVMHVRVPLREIHQLCWCMLMYAISFVPLIRQLSGLSHQVWYADDAAAGGRISQLRQWWNCLSSTGCHLGYFTNARNTWLVVKNEHLEHNQDIFAGTTCHPYLGAALSLCSLCRNTQHTVLSSGLRVWTVWSKT